MHGLWFKYLSWLLLIISKLKYVHYAIYIIYFSMFNGMFIKQFPPTGTTFVFLFMTLMVWIPACRLLRFAALFLIQVIDNYNFLSVVYYCNTNPPPLKSNEKIILLFFLFKSLISRSKCMLKLIQYLCTVASCCMVAHSGDSLPALGQNRNR